MLQTEIIAKEVYVNCPSCDERQEGFIGDPRGGEYECDDCSVKYKVHDDADIEMY